MIYYLKTCSCHEYSLNTAYLALATTNQSLATTNQSLATTNQSLATTNQSLATINQSLATSYNNQSVYQICQVIGTLIPHTFVISVLHNS